METIQAPNEELSDNELVRYVLYTTPSNTEVRLALYSDGPASPPNEFPTDRGWLMLFAEDDDADDTRLVAPLTVDNLRNLAAACQMLADTIEDRE